MPIMSEQFAVVMSKKLDSFKAIGSFCTQHAITAANVANPANIHNLDKAVSANPSLGEEAINMVELTTHLSVFYGQSEKVCYTEVMANQFAKLRSSWTVRRTDSDAMFQQNIMSEYNMTSENEAYDFIWHNPIILGVYIYVSLKALVE